MMSSRKYKIDYILSNMIECKMDKNTLTIMRRLEKNTRHRDNLILEKEDLEIELTKLCKRLMLRELLKLDLTKLCRRLMLEELVKKYRRYAWI